MEWTRLNYPRRVTIQGSTRERLRFAGALATCFALAASSAPAQVRVLPRTSQPGSTETYVLQVANTHQQAITSIEVRFPRSVRIISLGEPPNWPVQAFNAGNRLSAAAWSGTLPPGRYTEFRFVGVNGQKSVTLIWPVLVTYADSARVAWWPNSIGTKAPATVITAPPRSNESLSLAFVVCIIAFVLALTALVLSIRTGTAPVTGFHQDG